MDRSSPESFAVHNRSSYVKGCRCDVCKRANADYAAKTRALGIVGSRRTHGRPGTYTAGCRCARCTSAWRDFKGGRYSPGQLDDFSPKAHELVFKFDGKKGDISIRCNLHPRAGFWPACWRDLSPESRKTDHCTWSDSFLADRYVYGSFQRNVALEREGDRVRVRIGRPEQ